MHSSTQRSACPTTECLSTLPERLGRRSASGRPYRSTSGSLARVLAATGTVAVIVAGLAAVAPTAAASPTRMTQAAPLAYTPTPADQRIVTALNARVTTARFGSSFSGAVVDSRSDSVVWQRNGTTTRMPASTTKLVTA
ncbi:MAG: D-alanyl-D-alanine carboxypeptidase, partial [Dermatophilaceae bacterium]